MWAREARKVSESGFGESARDGRLLFLIAQVLGSQDAFCFEEEGGRCRSAERGPSVGVRLAKGGAGRRRYEAHEGECFDLRGSELELGV